MANDDKLVNLADLKAAFDDVDSRAGVTGVKGSSESDYRTGNVNLTPANIGAVSKSGDTMTGNLNINRAVTDEDSIRFGSEAGTSDNYISIHQNAWGILYYMLPVKNASNGALRDSRFRFFEYSPNTDGTRTNYAETYLLPVVDTGRTSSSSYNILTTKSPVTVAQGGTGATKAADARANLEITPANIGAVDKSGDTMTGNLTVSRAGASGFYVNNTNNSNQIGLINGSNGISGVYSSKISDYLIRIDSNGTVRSDFFVSSTILGNAMNTKALIYAELSKLLTGTMSIVRVSEEPLKLLTGKELNFSAQGTVYRSGDNYYFDLTRLSGTTRWSFKTTVTASAITPDTVYQYTGTALS